MLLIRIIVGGMNVPWAGAVISAITRPSLRAVSM